MTKKKAKENEEPRFELKKRTIKEKPNFFQNIPSFRHPLAEILNFPPDNSVEPPATELLPEALKKEISGHPEFNQINTQTPSNLDTQNLNIINTQSLNNSDTQTKLFLDTQNFANIAPANKQHGHPESKSISAQTPRNKVSAPRISKTKSAQAPRNEKIAHSKNEDWRKYDNARSTVRVNLHIDKEIDKKVRKYCLIDADPKVELREFYERAAIHLLNFLDTQNLGSLGAETPLDDRRLKMMYKTKPFIINLYLRYNAVFNELSGTGKKWTARWTPRDDEAAARYNDLDPAIIELGILQTQMQKSFGSSRIQTFKYYTDEIENVITSGVSDEMLETILQYHRQIWKKQTSREVDLSFLSDE